MPQITDDIPKWFDAEPSQLQKSRFKHAVVDYVHHKKLRHNPPKPSVHLSKTILPYLQVLDRKWEKVTSSNFNPAQHRAHQRFVDTARNLLNSKAELEHLYSFYYEDEISQEAEQDNNANAQRSPEPMMPMFGTTDPTAIPDQTPIRVELPDSSGLATPQQPPI